jgi:3-deoxy-manno-octulosonate cytidylyltransferase (CMP-KDO synthetase)
MSKKINEYLIFIPARYKSSRFPGKPLAKILGKEMIEYVYETCDSIKKNKTFVLTDSQKILNFCQKKNFRCLMTPKNCLTGTDRLIYISKKIKSKIYINVQGDEPLIEKHNLNKFISIAKKNKNEILIAKSKINEEQFQNVNLPKIITNKKNYLIYISRSKLPGTKLKKTGKIKEIFGQVNLYSYPYKVLSNMKLYNKKNFIEKNEDIEILRYLYEGYKIKVVNLNSNNHPVDVPNDIKIVENIILKKNDNRKFK